MPNPYQIAFNVLTRHGDSYTPFYDRFSGRRQRDLTQASNIAQIDYDQYLKAGNERALRDWYKNVGGGRQIKYPELSYSGQIYRAATSVARNLIDYSIADTNYVSSLPYRAAGLYGAGTRFSRFL